MYDKIKGNVYFIIPFFKFRRKVFEKLVFSIVFTTEGHNLSLNTLMFYLLVGSNDTHYWHEGGQMEDGISDQIPWRVYTTMCWFRNNGPFS